MASATVTWTRALIWCLLVPVMAGTAAAVRRSRDTRAAALRRGHRAAVHDGTYLRAGRCTPAAASRPWLRSTRYRGTTLDLLERQRRSSRTHPTNCAHRSPSLSRTPNCCPGPNTDPEGSRGRGDRRRRAQRLRRLADRLLLLATAEQSGHHRPVPTRLAAVLDDTLSRWERIPRHWQLGQHDDVTVLADPDRLVVALDAILDNAVRFTCEGDTIELSVSGATGTPTSRSPIPAREFQAASSTRSSTASARRIQTGKPRTTSGSASRSSGPSPKHTGARSPPTTASWAVQPSPTAAAARSTGQPGPSLQPAAVPAEQ